MTHDHLDDEQLSAHLDGEAHGGAIHPTERRPSVAAEIAACGTCRQRLAALSEARDLVRLPVAAVPPSLRAAAVEAAISEVFGPDAALGSPSAVTVLQPQRRPRQSRVLIGAAAAVAVLAVAVGVPLGLIEGGSTTAPSAAPSVATTVAHSPEQRAATPSAAAPGVTATEAGGLTALGTVASAADLRSRLLPVIASVGAGKDAAGHLSAAGNPVTTVPAASGGFAVNGSLPAAFAPCVAAAEKATDTPNAAEIVGTLTYDHTPALVVVVPVTRTSSNTSSAHVAVVVARSGCGVLVRTTL